MNTTGRKISISCATLAVCLWTVILSGCNKPLLNEFKEYTENVHMMRAEINVSTADDNDGVRCVTSEQPVTITYRLTNPQQYRFDPITITYADRDPDYTGTQDAFGTITFVLQPDDLDDIDGNDGGILNPTLFITDPPTGRVFGPFEVELRCNTPPATVENMVVLLDTTDNNNTYVLAWNMPDMSGIHDDISSITITAGSNTIKNADVTPGSDLGSTGLSADDGFKFTIGSYQVLPPQNVVFSGENSDSAVYYPTGIPVPDSEEEMRFTVTLRDQKNFSSSVSVSNTSKRMDQPVISIGTKQSADGSLPVTITAADGGTVYYRIEYSGDTTTPTFVRGSSTGIPPLESGTTATVSAFVRKENQIDSIWATNTEATSDAFNFVYAGGGNTSLTSPKGTKNRPYATVEEALAADFTNKTKDGFTIRLAATDSAPTAGMTLSGTPVPIDGGSWDDIRRTLQRKSITVGSGTWNFTSLAAKATDKIEINTGTALNLTDSSITAADITVNSQLSLANSAITATSVTATAAIDLTAGSVITGNISTTSTVSLDKSSINGTVTLTNAGTGNCIIVKNIATGTAKLATIDCENLTSGTTVLEGGDNFTLTDDTLSRFALTKESWYLVLNERNTAAVRAPGVSIEAPGKTTLTAEFNVNGTTVTLDKITDKKSGSTVTLTDCTLAVMLEGKEIEDKEKITTGSSSVTFNSTCPDGTYTVRMTGKYNGVGYDAEVTAEWKTTAGVKTVTLVP